MLMLMRPIALGLLLLCTAANAQLTKSLPDAGAGALSEKEMKYLVGLCEGCHGPGGVSSRTDVPTLASRPAQDLFAEIERFYFYERICPDVPVDGLDPSQGHMSMCDVTSRINRQEAQALAQYFEGQPLSQ